MPNPFAITSTESYVRLGAERRAQVIFTVFNASGDPIRGRARLVAQDPPVEPWLSLSEEPERDFALAGTAQYAVHIDVPADAMAGSYPFRLDMLDVEDPEESYSEGPTVTLEVPEPRPPKPFPWWILLVVAGAVVVAAVIAFLVWPRKTRMPNVLELALSEAQATLTTEGLRVGATLEIPDTTSTPGYVVASTPEPEAVITPESTVVLVLAAGPTPVPEPVTVDLTADADRYWQPRRTICFPGTCPDFGHGDELLLWNASVNVGGNLPLLDAGMAAIRFPMEEIPAGATVEEATLHLQLQSGEETGLQVHVRRASSPWSEDETTRPSCESGGAAVSNVGQTAGRYSWNVTEIVQYQQANPGVNYGFCLTLSRVGKRTFASREGPNSTRPRLTITYRP